MSALDAAGGAPSSAALSADQEAVAEKGLKSGALSLLSSIVIGVASTAPAYSLAATLGLIAVAVGVVSPIIVLIAFVPMLFISIGYSELNKADPDCGTTFTWATRTFGPWVGWMGGWGIVASDVLVMASLAQVTGQYGFLFFGAKGIGHDPTSGWVLLVGVLFIVLLTWVCYAGIELTARLQRVLLGLEVLVLIILAAVALIRVAAGTAPASHLDPSWSWFNVASISPTKAITGVLLMLFIYWGWDTSVSVNEETSDRTRKPGLAAIISTVILLSTYFIVTLGVEAFAGVGHTGIGLANPANYSDVFSALGSAVFGHSWIGSVGTHLLILMVLTSAAASTQTTILPTARTTLSMSVYKALPDAFGKMHRRNLTPTVSTVTMGGISIVLYVAFNQLAGGNLIPDAVTGIGVWIAFYYGLTGFTSFWYYRSVLRRSARDLFMKGILPIIGGLMLWFAMFWSLWADWNYNNTFAESYTSWHLPFPPHSEVGGVFLVAVVSGLVGVVVMLLLRFGSPAFFRGETLNRTTGTLVPEDTGVPLLLEDEAGEAELGGGVSEPETGVGAPELAPHGPVPEVGEMAGAGLAGRVIDRRQE